MWAESTEALQNNQWKNLGMLSDSIQAGADYLKTMMAEVKDSLEGLEDVSKLQKIHSLAGELKALARASGTQLNDQTIKAVNELYDESQKRTAWMLGQATPSNVGINMDFIPQDQVMSMLSSTFQGGQFSANIFAISDEVARDMQDKLVQGVLLGKSVDDMAGDILDLWGDDKSGYGARAMTIARTETIKAREYARDRMFKNNADVLDGEEWVTLESTGAEGQDYPCELCSDVEEEHNEEGHTWLQPVVDTHPNCVCTKIAVVKKWQELLGEDNEGETPPEEVKPFEEFKKEVEKGTEKVAQEVVNFQPYYSDETGKLMLSGGDSIDIDLGKYAKQYTKKEVADWALKYNTDAELHGVPKIVLAKSYTSKSEMFPGFWSKRFSSFAGLHVADIDIWIKERKNITEVIIVNPLGSKDVEATIAHEVAHHQSLDIRFMQTTTKGNKIIMGFENKYIEMKQSRQWSKFPSTWSQKNERELLAETVKFYKVNPAGFKKDFPELATLAEEYVQYFQGVQ